MIGAAVASIGDGQVVGIGGMMLARRPVALCRALAARHPRDLEIVSLTSSLETDVLIDAGCVGVLRTSMISLGLFGFAPAWAEAVRAGAVHSPRETEMSIALGLRAAMAGIGFEPAIAWHGTSYVSERSDVKMIECPYTGEEYVAFPRIDIDAALVHAVAADEYGNAVLGLDLGVDRELARSATLTIVSTERLVSSEELQQIGEIDVVARDVEFVVEVPGGAAPTACEPHYPIDAAPFLLWSEQRRFAAA